MDDIIAWLITLIDFNTTAIGTDAERCVSFICETLTARGMSVRTYTTAGNRRKAHHLLAEVPGDFSGSEMVKSVTGVDNVCERSAVLKAGGEIVVKKMAENGVTMAVAMKEYRPDWEWKDE